MQILCGEGYERVFGVWDGYAQTFCTCRFCLELREWAIISVPCFCWSHGDLLQEIRELVQEVSYKVPGMFFEYGRKVVRHNRQLKLRRKLTNP